VALGPFAFNGSLRKKTQKNEHFFTPTHRGDERQKVPSRVRSFRLFFCIKKKHTHKTQMNVLSTHAVALHGMNARESQRTPTSASTSSLIARKNTTRSHNNNTKKNINAARHRRQRSIIRYARDNNWKDFRRFLTAPSSRDDDLSWVYDVNDDHSRSSLLLFLPLEFSRFIASSSSPRFTSSGKAAALSAREERFPCSFFKGIIKSGQRGDS